MRSLCLVLTELLFAQEGPLVFVLPSRALPCKLTTAGLHALDPGVGFLWKTRPCIADGAKRSSREKKTQSSPPGARQLAVCSCGPCHKAVPCYSLCCSSCPDGMEDVDASEWGSLGLCCAPSVRAAAGAGSSPALLPLTAPVQPPSSGRTQFLSNTSVSPRDLLEEPH